MNQLLQFSLLLIFLVACDKDPSPPLAPIVATGNASNVENTTASVSMTITDVLKTKEIGVLYSISSTELTSTNAQKVSIENFTSGDNSISLTGLLPGTTYYFMAYASDGTDFIYGAINNFTTGIDYPTLTTNSVSNITTTQATCGGNISSNGGGTINARGICWSTSSDPTISLATKTVDGNGIKSFTSNIAGLQAETTYYVRAYATNEKGTAYGAQVTFTTLPIALPTLTTTSISSISTSTATSGGNVISDGGAIITARGVCWSTIATPTIADNKTSDCTGLNAFTSSITGLTANTTYYVRAYATNSAGTAYGSAASFKATDGQIINNQTINGYTLTQNEIWSGTILLKGDVIVPSGITLTIIPGTIINIFTGTPVYDGGYSSGIIEFKILGSLIINGTAQNIIQLKSAASSPSDIDWAGITMIGNRLEMEYCHISDAYDGVWCSNSLTAMKIKNCLFNNMRGRAIIDFGSLPISLTYNSFINVYSGYTLFKSNRNVQIDYSEFNNNNIDIDISGTSTNINNNSSITVNYSNFSQNTWYNLYWSPDEGVTNSDITSNHCYGITTYPTNGSGNTYTYLNPLSAPYSSAGCGFSSMVKSASLRSYSIENPEQKKRMMQEHDEEINRMNEELKRQQNY